MSRLRGFLSVCPTPGCGELTSGGLCGACKTSARRRDERQRPRSQRRYGETFERNRRRLLAAHPACACGCGRPANTADHWPTSRRDLVAQGVADPDAIERMRPMYVDCHNRSTAAETGFGAR